MVIGNKKHNYIFYKGYEGEAEIVFKTSNADIPVLHIWEGFIEDLLQHSEVNKDGWFGLTRDYHECLGPFSYACKTVVVNVQEYISDLKSYTNKIFSYEETREVLCLLLDRFQAVKNNQCENIIIENI